MRRRNFLRILGAATTAPRAVMAAPRPPGATVLYNDRTVVLDRIGAGPSGDAQALWIRKSDLPRVNEFEVKPQGACRADVCIPIPKRMTRGGYFDLAAFAKKAGQAVVAEPAAR